MKKISGIAVTVVLVLIVALAIWGWLVLSQGVAEGEEGPWVGVDVNVIEKYATDAGREPQAPLINTDQGDMLLFVFALGGAIGGFIMGYFWRRLISEKKEEIKANS